MFFHTWRLHMPLRWYCYYYMLLLLLLDAIAEYSCWYTESYFLLLSRHGHYDFIVPLHTASSIFLSIFIAGLPLLWSNILIYWYCLLLILFHRRYTAARHIASCIFTILDYYIMPHGHYCCHYLHYFSAFYVITSLMSFVFIYATIRRLHVLLFLIYYIMWVFAILLHFMLYAISFLHALLLLHLLLTIIALRHILLQITDCISLLPLFIFSFFILILIEIFIFFFFFIIFFFI